MKLHGKNGFCVAVHLDARPVRVRFLHGNDHAIQMMHSVQYTLREEGLRDSLKAIASKYGCWIGVQSVANYKAIQEAGFLIQSALWALSRGKASSVASLLGGQSRFCFLTDDEVENQVDSQTGVWQSGLLERKFERRPAKPSFSDLQKSFANADENKAAYLSALWEVTPQQDRDHAKKLFEEVELRDYQVLIFGDANPTKARFVKWLAIEGKDIANEDIPFVARAIQHYVKKYDLTPLALDGDGDLVPVNVSSGFRRDRNSFRFVVYTADDDHRQIGMATTLPTLVCS